MVYPVVVQKQGQSVESRIITEIFRKAGDQVEKGEFHYTYETDKASFEAEAPESGEILVFFVEAGDEVPVLTNIAVIGEKGESIE